MGKYWRLSLKLVERRFFKAPRIYFRQIPSSVIYRKYVIFLLSFPLCKFHVQKRFYVFLSSQEFRQLLDENTGIFVKMNDLLIGWIQKGFQDFFRSLESHFLVLSGKTSSWNETEGLVEGKSSEKIHAGLILVLAQLSVVIEQKVIPRIAEVTSLTPTAWCNKFKLHW